jgi:hypothetical protein
MLGTIRRWVLATKVRPNPRVVGWRRTVALALTVVALAAGCSRLPARTPHRPEAFEQVLAKRQSFSGLRARGSLTLEHKADVLTVPLEITVTQDLVLEVHSSISHFLLPFEGEVRLVSDEASTLLYTNVGTYDLAMDPEAQPGVRAFLLSLAGGGDWLLWWLAGRDCDLSAESQCGGLEIELKPHARLPAISGWKISEPSRGVAFKAGVDEYEPGTTVPRIVTGILEPNEITLYLNYTEISVSPDSAR